MTHSRRDARVRLSERALLASAIALICAPAVHAQPATGAQQRASIIEEITVTAQRRDESVQDVPIAVSAFSGAMLEDRQIITPSDLQMNAPNVSYTDTNFGSSSFSIRGIGRLVTATSGDAGVSIHTNDIPLPTNLPAAEFFDMERVEVLRGPQGTLFGRNATGGVVNMITARPSFEKVEGFLDLELGDYSNRRAKGAFNLPVTDNFALRLAGMYLKRDGYIENTAADAGVPGVKDSLDGRDLYSIRLTGQWDISERASAWAMYTRFKEDDDKVRITNQICQRNELPTTGCDPDGFAFDGVHPGSTTGGIFSMLAGAVPLGAGTVEQGLTEPFPAPGNLGLRRVHTDFQPEYKYKEDVFAGGFSYDFDNFRVSLLGGYHESTYLSRQDYNIDVGVGMAPTVQFDVDAFFAGLDPLGAGPGIVPVTAYPTSDVSRGVFDPTCNLFDGTFGLEGGCSLAGAPGDRVFSYDQADSEAEYYTLELRLESDFQGPFNFQVGGNYAKTESSGNYYVVFNSLDIVTNYGSPFLGFPPLYPGVFDSHSSGPGYEADARSVFGEVYYQATDNLKFTLGLRYNRDEKRVRDAGYLFNSIEMATACFGALGDPTCGPLAGFGLTPLTGKTFVRTPFVVEGYLFGEPLGGQSQALVDFFGLSDQAAAAVTLDDRLAIAQAVPLAPVTGESRALTGSPDKETFTATTGRVGFDWQVNENTMVYGFFSRGYKPGGFNPPVNPEFQASTPFTFDKEEVDAFEIGAKNTFLNNTMVLNASLFTYDYKGLQIAKIENNTAVNDNVDADIYGAELEVFWRPEAIPALSIDLSYSWLKTKVAGGTSLLDTVDRTQGDPSLLLLKNIDPGSNTGVNFVANANDVAAVTSAFIAANPALNLPGIANYDDPTGINPDGIPAFFSRNFLQQQFEAGNIANAPFDGVLADVGGNRLPNSPEHTIHIGLAWTFNLAFGSLTPRWDYYWQSSSFGREYNRPGDRISSWDQHNASIIFESHDQRWTARAFIRNILNDDNVTGHYVTSDTSGLFRNYFLTEPRIYGASLRLNF